MAKFLAYQGRPVVHDLGAHVDTVDQFLGGLGPATLAGIVETGSVLGWELVARAWPDTRFVVVRRDPAEVAASLARFGIVMDAEDVAARLAAMDRLAARPGSLVLGYNALANPLACAGLFEHCLGVPFDWAWWKAMDAENVQVDMPARLEHLVRRTNVALSLRAELADRLANPRPFEWVGWQPWRELADEIAELGAGHYAEADDTRTFRLDIETLGRVADAGILFAAAARVDGRMVAYCTWSKEPDTEAVGHTIINQGAWYCLPGYRLGMRLLNWCIDQLRAQGETHLRLHHTLSGRGAKLASVFKRMGAVECKREYDLRFGDA